VNIRLYIDYDNVSRALKKNGLLSLVTRCLLTTKIPTTTKIGRCEVRVYGGWYEGSTLTALAECIIAELVQGFPTILPFSNQAGNPGMLYITAELACSLEAEPSRHLFNTFRRKSPPRSLICAHPTTIGCADPECPLNCLPAFFNNEQCPKQGCKIGLHDLLSRQEQKLVDTMLACDIIHAARIKCDFTMLVSSDDDLLPAIRMALLDGAPIARLHPKTFYQSAAFPAGGTYFVEIPL
jgi:hypothetical protein